MSTINTEESAHKMLKTFCEIIQQSAKENIPRGKPCKYKPFWTQELNEQKKMRDRAKQKAEKSKLQEDVLVWREENTKLNYQITQSKRNSWNSFLSKLNYKTDRQKAFKLMNKLNNRYFQKQSQPFKLQDKEITEDKKIANCFNVYFSNTHKLKNHLKKQGKTIKTNSEMPTNNNFKELFYFNFSEELKEAIRNTKVKKQPGPDNIFPEFIHNLGPKAMKILTTIYNKLWSSRDNLPDDWKKAIIVPILKPDKPANLISSYRPTALTSILVKIQERMILARLNWYLKNQNLLTEEQAGFRQNRSTMFQLTKLTQQIKRAFNQRESVLAVFVDFSRAYDSIWRAKLIEKLKNMNIQGNMLAWISRFLDQK